VKTPAIVLMAWALVGPIRLERSALLFGAIAIFGSFIADLVWTHAISFLSFWIEDTMGLHLLYRRLLMLLGGMFLPLDAYPAWLRAIAEAVPFRALVYDPIRLLFRPSADVFVHVISQQLFWTCIGLIPMAIAYRLGLRRVAAQGG
jgi:ABC-2 type transport system permease protein